MEPINYRSNSHASKEQRTVESEEPERRVNGPVASAKRRSNKPKSGLLKLADVFLAEDLEDVKTHIIDDYLIPSVKDTLLNGFALFLGVDDFPMARRGGRTNYSGRYRRSDARESERRNADRRSRDYDGPREIHMEPYEDIWLESRGDCEYVQYELEKVLDEYQIVRVGDLYGLVDLSTSPSDWNYGWNRLDRMRVIHRSDGWHILMPKAIYIDER